MGTTLTDGVIREVPYALLRNFATDLGAFTLAIKDRNGNLRDWPVLTAQFQAGIPFYSGDEIKIIFRAPVRGGFRVCDIWNVNPATGEETFDSSISFTAPLQRAAKVTIASTAGNYRLTAAVPATLGRGYQPDELLTFVGGTADTVSTVTITHLQAVSATVVASGTSSVLGYTVPLAGGTGDPASLTITAVKARTSARNDPGTGYTVGDQLTLAGGTPVQSTVVRVNSAQSMSATVWGSGTNYQVGEALRLDGGTSSVAGTLTVDSLKSEASTTVVAAGSLYNPQDTITPSGGVNSRTVSIKVSTVKAVSAVVPNYNSAGLGYAIGEVVTLAGGVGTPAEYYVNNLQASTVESFGATGSNYQVGGKLMLVGGSYVTPGTISILAVSTTGSLIAASVVPSRGDYSVVPVGPVETFDYTGTGGGATLGIAYAILGGTISNAGAYTAIPENPVQQEFSDGSGVGASFNVEWGVNSAAVEQGGVYTGIPANPVAQQSSSGTGYGATFDLSWKLNAVSFSTPGTYTAVPANHVATSHANGSGSGATLDVAWGVYAGTVLTAGTYTAIPSNSVGHTTATGTNATFNVTWVAQSATVLSSGSYTVLPNSPVAENSGTTAGETFSMTWGPKTVSLTNVGDYPTVPSNPVAVTSGTGNGATFTAAWEIFQGAVSKTTSYE